MLRHRKRLALAVLLSSALALAAAEKPSPKPSVAELIEQLNSRDFKKREAATRALMKRDDALPALREALKSSHAEVRRRAALILDQRENGTKRRVLKRALACI
jgi:HEAT repeat protein